MTAREELRALRYDLDKIAERARLGRPGRHDAERRPALIERLRELTPSAPAAPSSTPMRYRDPERT